MDEKVLQENMTLNFPNERPEESLGFMFWQITNIWQRKTTKALEELAITHVQFVLLAGIAWLVKEHTAVTQSMLSKHAKTDIMMTSKVLRTLEKKCLITRISYYKDTRAKVLQLTPQGTHILIEALERVVMVDTEFFSCLYFKREQFMENLHILLKHNKKYEK